MERMSWLSKLHPRAAGHRASRSASLQSPPTADPETCFMVFTNHWRQVLRILEKGGPQPGPGAADDLSAVRNNTYQMVTLLVEERVGAGPGPILQLVLAENLLERLLLWLLRRDGSEEQRAEQLKLYEMLISQSRQPLLRHPPVRGPLLHLLRLCAEPASPALQASLVLLLSQLCGCVARDPGLLELFFQPPAPPGPADLLPFSLLVPFVHREGPTGQQARDALLLLLALAAGNRAVASYITEGSYFCPVLATGLSALYSSLPRRIELRADDWHCLRREDWMGMPALVLFMNSLEFCNAVLQVAHPLVQKQLVDYVHNGFLVPVMGPALHKTAVEELTASTAYLELFLRSVSHPALLRTFLRFILLHRHDQRPLLDTLLARLAATSRLCLVSLSLFRTLLNLNCEDVMLQLVLRYLIPCSHVMLSQKRAVRDLDIYGKTAAKFLSLIPQCCRAESLPGPDREEEHATWAKAHGSPTVDTSSVVTVPKPSTPSRLAFFMRQPSGTWEPGPASPSGSPGPRPARWEEVAELDGNYLEYLQDAQHSVEQCALACRVWSAPYDGEHPPAAPPANKKRGPPEEGGALAPGSSEPSAGPPAPDGEDSAPLLNGAELGRDVMVKKVRRAPPPGGSERGGLPAENGPPSALSVDSLLDELLARAPSEPSGSRLTIESFSRELRELEAELQSGARQPPPSPAGQPPPSPAGQPPLSPSGQPPPSPAGQPPLSHSGQPPPSPAGPLSRDEEETYERFAAPPERRTSAASRGVPGPLAQLVCSPMRALGQPPSQPFTGPFVAVLLARLENMVGNSLYVNVLLTGLVARLACYPQPLLRSFLLNTNMVFQPSVKSLLQVLGSVKNRIESFAARQDDFPALLFRARKYLLARAQLDWTDANPAPALRRPDTLVKSRKPSIGELILRHTQSPTRARQAAQLALREAPGGAEPPSEALRVRNAVYSAVIFSEFLKELAATAQAHAVTPPFPPDPEG